MTARHTSAALRPGLIILLGVAAIALILITILLLPPPNIRTAVERLIPPDTQLISELNYGDLIGMSGSTERTLIDLAAFYRKRLRLSSGAIVGGGISSWSEGRLIGGFRSGLTMPYDAEGFVILVRDKKELIAVIASRATNENVTSIELFCERKPAAQAAGFSRGSRAARFGPPDASPGSSASAPLIDGAMFKTGSPFTNVASHFFTNVLETSVPSLTNWTVSRAGSGMASIPKRIGARSVTFVMRSGTNETVVIHCFRSTNSPQTHVLVGSAAK